MIRLDRANVNTGRVLVVDDHQSARESMADVLRHVGHQVCCCGSAVEALRHVAGESYDVIVTDLKMPGMSGLELIRELVARQVDAQTVMVTAHGTITAAVEAMRFGAFDFIEKPFGIDQLEQLVDRAIRHGEETRHHSAVPAAQPAGSAVAPAMIGRSPVMETLRKRIAQIGPTRETVLITGESGTGKELVANSLHAASPRANQPVICFNCPALSPQLMESELFGHDKGAFTGADTQRVGRFELADRGTILMDEITEIPPSLQAKLLRVLQERTFERVGSCQPRATDVRVLAATNRNLLEEVQAGRFRQDLYFRLAVVPLEVPPLRERREDIPELINHFLAKAAARLESTPCDMSANATDLLLHHSWPGNVRELENIVTRACVLTGSKPVTADQIQPWLLGGVDASSGKPVSARSPMTGIEVGVSLQDMERRLIEATLDHFHGHRAHTAKALGIGIRTLANKLRSYGYAPREKSFLKAA